jgi:hypothetical protein
MKAISAVILMGGLRPGEVAAAGSLLLLGVTGWIIRFAHAIPQSLIFGALFESIGVGVKIKAVVECPNGGSSSMTCMRTRSQGR